jgi:hypothetical protein
VTLIAISLPMSVLRNLGSELNGTIPTGEGRGPSRCMAGIPPSIRTDRFKSEKPLHSEMLAAVCALKQGARGRHQ